jgi:hypothetical protein
MSAAPPAHLLSRRGGPRPCQPGCQCRRHKGWRELNPSYEARHKRMRKIRGPALAQVCVACIEQKVRRSAQQWAQVHGTDGLDPWADYVPLCIAHHLRYDYTSERRQKVTVAADQRQRDTLGRFA